MSITQERKQKPEEEPQMEGGSLSKDTLKINDGVQNNMQTAVAVDGNVIEPRQLIYHTEMIQSSFI